MPVSHRKFGDLLEEGIKRVHITRKKPIGFILDEFGYELRPDDSSKGRYALGHWYYKKRIPAEISDLTKLAELIVTNSDVDRGWLKSFLESAGYKDADGFCNQFFLPENNQNAASSQPAPEESEPLPAMLEQEPKTTASGKRNYSLFLYVLGAIAVISAVIFFIAGKNQAESSINNSTPADTSEAQPHQTPTPHPSAIFTAIPVTESVPTLIVPTIDFATFDGKCPAISAAPTFEYTSSQSFMDFLNAGGSAAKLQSDFKALVQNKANVQDGRIEVTDLTGDDVPEVIANAVFDKGSLWQILGCNNGEYQALVDIEDTDSRHLRFAVDLNGNKIPEIISYRKTQSRNTSLYEFMIHQWNGHQISDLVDNTRFDAVGAHLPADIFDWQRTVANATVTTRDTNGDGLYEVVIEGGLLTPVPTCETRFERQFTETWAWNGKSFQLADRVYIMPIYRFQRSADGDLAFALKQYDRALTAYQDVLFDANLFARDEYLPHLEFCKGIESTSENLPIKDERGQLEAYARWRILLINAINGSEDAMQVVYQTLQEKFPEDVPGHSYAVVADEFWKSYQTSQNLQQACENANVAAKSLTLHPKHTAENTCFIP